MSTDPYTNPAETDDTPLCCGEHYPGEEGEPIILACQLCPKSPTYWRVEDLPEWADEPADRQKNDQ